VAVEIDAVESLVAKQSTAAQEIVADAKTRLETLVRPYYLRHGFESYDSFMMQFLILLGNSALESLQTSGAESDTTLGTSALDTLRSTLILCLKGLHDQGLNYYVAGDEFRVLRDRMGQEDRALLGKYVSLEDSNQEDRHSMALHVQAQWVIPIIKLNEDPKLQC
jgi:hypothetical protein